MTIKTLEYIHSLMQEDTDRTRTDYDAARKLQYQYEESETVDSDLVSTQKKIADEYYRLWIKASNALEDFESQEW